MSRAEPVRRRHGLPAVCVILLLSTAARAEYPMSSTFLRAWQPELQSLDGEGLPPELQPFPGIGARALRGDFTGAEAQLASLSHGRTEVLGFVFAHWLELARLDGMYPVVQTVGPIAQVQRQLRADPSGRARDVLRMLDD